jgi:hypothetical protein
LEDELPESHSLLCLSFLLAELDEILADSLARSASQRS